MGILKATKKDDLKSKNSIKISITRKNPMKAFDTTTSNRFATTLVSSFTAIKLMPEGIVSCFCLRYSLILFTTRMISAFEDFLITSMIPRLPLKIVLIFSSLYPSFTIPRSLILTKPPPNSDRTITSPTSSIVSN